MEEMCEQEFNFDELLPEEAPPLKEKRPKRQILKKSMHYCIKSVSGSLFDDVVVVEFDDKVPRVEILE